MALDILLQLYFLFLYGSWYFLDSIYGDKIFISYPIDLLLIELIVAHHLFTNISNLVNSDKDH